MPVSAFGLLQHYYCTTLRKMLLPATGSFEGVVQLDTAIHDARRIAAATNYDLWVRTGLYRYLNRLPPVDKWPFVNCRPVSPFQVLYRAKQFPPQLKDVFMVQSPRDSRYYVPQPLVEVTKALMSFVTSPSLNLFLVDGNRTKAYVSDDDLTLQQILAQSTGTDSTGYCVFIVPDEAVRFNAVHEGLAVDNIVNVVPPEYYDTALDVVLGGVIRSEPLEIVVLDAHRYSVGFYYDLLTRKRNDGDASLRVHTLVLAGHTKCLEPRLGSFFDLLCTHPATMAKLHTMPNAGAHNKIKLVLNSMETEGDIVLTCSGSKVEAERQHGIKLNDWIQNTTTGEVVRVREMVRFECREGRRSVVRLDEAPRGAQVCINDEQIMCTVGRTHVRCNTAYIYNFSAMNLERLTLDLGRMPLRKAVALVSTFMDDAPTSVLNVLGEKEEEEEAVPMLQFIF